jgi:hypothetical protein
VEEGQHHEYPVVARQIEEELRVEAVVEALALREQGALGHACGSGGVEQQDGILAATGSALEVWIGSVESLLPGIGIERDASSAFSWSRAAGAESSRT